MISPSWAAEAVSGRATSRAGTPRAAKVRTFCSAETAAAAIRADHTEPGPVVASNRMIVAASPPAR